MAAAEQGKYCNSPNICADAWSNRKIKQLKKDVTIAVESNRGTMKGEPRLEYMEMSELDSVPPGSYYDDSSGEELDNVSVHAGRH